MMHLHPEHSAHAFHLWFTVAGLVAFASWAIRDIRRHGLPRFTWKLAPEPMDRVGRSRRLGAAARR